MAQCCAERKICRSCRRLRSFAVDFQGQDQKIAACGSSNMGLAFNAQPPEAIRLQENPMNLVELTERLHAIRDRNDWRQFHSPKNLAMAASVEMSELVEIFQWLTEDQSRQLPADKLAHAGQEVGDIVLYLLLLCSELGLDMNEVVRSKLADSERRFS